MFRKMEVRWGFTIKYYVVLDSTGVLSSRESCETQQPKADR